MAAVAADLDNNGYSDLLLTNHGGYDSRSSTGTNLKVQMDGRPRVVPPPDHFYPNLTNFEPGRTRLFMNRSSGAHWLKVRLEDPDSPNRDAVGAEVLVNGSLLRVKRAGDGGYVGNVFTDLIFGLGDDKATEIEVRWPDKERSVSHFRLEGLSHGTLVVTRSDVQFTPQDPTP